MKHGNPYNVHDTFAGRPNDNKAPKIDGLKSISMVIYIFIIVFLIISTLKKRNKLLYIVSFFLLFMVGSLRGLDVGTDTKNYQGMYEVIKSIQAQSFLLFEPGWVVLNLLGSSLFNNYRSVLFFSQGIILTILFIRLWKSTSNPYFGILFYVLLYYYLNSFNITRQVIAMIFVFNGLFYLINKKKRWFIFYVVIASLFHYSSLFCLFFPFINKIPRFSTSTNISILSITYFSGLYIIPYILDYIPYLGKYMVYIEMGAKASGSFSRLLLNCFFIFIYPYLRNNKYMIFFFWGIVMYNLLAFSPAAGRIAVYLMISQLYIVSDIHCKTHKATVQIISLFLIYGFVQFFSLLSANVSEVVPYKFM